MSESKVSESCECIDRANEALKPSHSELALMFTVSGSTYIQIATQLLDDAPKTRPKLKPKLLAATFCPFCGVKV